MATVIEIENKIKSARAERYAMQSVAKKAIPEERVSMCLRRLNGGYLQVWQHIETRKAFYDGLMVCGSVWNCPVCASKISERRKKELEIAFRAHTQEKGLIAMLTLTFRHSIQDDLRDLMDKFTTASSKFRSGKRWDKIVKKMGVIGSVRSFEVTYGKNGFHPHTHLALFYKNDVDLELIKIEMYELWEKALNKVGLEVLEGYGLDLQFAENANDYLAKHGTWSLEHELSKTHIKQGKKGSLTPFDFLRWYLYTEEDRFLKLFRVYAETMKGKRQLYWSRGLKAHFDLVDKSDEEVAKESTEKADFLGLLDYDDWKCILIQDARAQFLDAVEEFGLDEARLLYIKKESLSK